MTARPGRRVLILRSSSLGDIAHVVPAVAALREDDPSRHIGWLVNTPLAGFVRDLAPVDRIHRFDREALRGRPSGRGLRSLLALVLELRAERYDTVLDFQALLRTDILGLLSGAPRRLGPGEGREGSLFKTRRVRTWPRARHPAERAAALVGALGVVVPEPLRIATTPAMRAAALALGDIGAAPGVVLAPGARWPSKVWPRRHWLELGRLIGSAARPVTVVGTADERALADELAAAAGGRSLAGETDAAALAGLLDHAALVVGSDSGALQLAAMLGRPTLALFGPTRLSWTWPRGPGARVLHRRLDCLGCRARRCPRTGHPCMNELEPALVADAVLTSLAEIETRAEADATATNGGNH